MHSTFFRIKFICQHQRFCSSQKKLLSSSKTLLCEENKKRLLECMKKLPPVGIQLSNPDKEKKYAAVLIALCTSKNKSDKSTYPPNTEANAATTTSASLHEDSDVSILYTKRSIHLSRHVRQVSFPGGLQDHTDNDYIDCALRETEEEIGLPRSRVEVLGTGCIIRPPSTAAIMPVIGIIRNLDLNELTLNPDEVEDVFTVPINDLIAPGTVKHTQFKSGFSSPIFLVKPFKIWGVTGFITNNFLQCLLPKDAYKQRIKFIRPYKVA